MLKNVTQELYKYKIATYNRMLNNNSICPANHDVNYYNSWYYFDGKPEQKPEITRKAKDYYDNPNVIVKFNKKFNTHVLVDMPNENY